MRQPRLASAVSMFLDAVVDVVTPSTTAVYAGYLRSFLDDVGNVRLDAITPAVVRKWNPTYHAIGSIRRMLRWCVVEARILAVNPIDGMRATRPAGRMRILARAERVSLMRSADRVFRRFLLAMTETIARPREIRAVRWGDVRTCGSPAWSVADLVAGRCFFRLVRFKGQESRRDRLAVRNIPISRRLGRLLVRMSPPIVTLTDCIFSNRSRRPWTCNAVRCRFRRLRLAAKLPADVDGENVVAYSIRHTSATDAVGAGVKGLVLAELMGHSDVRMTQRYVHLRPDHLIAAMNRIGEVKTARKPKNDLPRSSRIDPDGDGRVS